MFFLGYVMNYAERFGPETLQAYQQSQGKQRDNLVLYLTLYYEGSPKASSVSDFDVVLSEKRGLTHSLLGDRFEPNGIYAPRKGSKFLEWLIQECTARILEFQNVANSNSESYTSGSMCITDVYEAKKHLISIQVLPGKSCGNSWKLQGLFLVIATTLVGFLAYRRFGRIVFVFVGALLFHSYVTCWNDRRNSMHSEPVTRDIIHDMLPRIPASIEVGIYNGMEAISFLGSAYLLLQKDRNVSTRFLLMMSATLVARSLFIAMTSLPKLDQEACTKTPVEKAFGGACHDKIFSGHVAGLLIVLWNIYTKFGSPVWAKYTFSSIGVLASVLTVALRKHYTVDVAVSWLWVALLVSHKARFE